MQTISARFDLMPKNVGSARGGRNFVPNFNINKISYAHLWPDSYFYEKYGFYEEPEIHLSWHCYGDSPFPTMVKIL